MCLGGLFVPEAYITATRQYVAQANSWSLEELCLEVNVTTSQSATLDACSFGVTGELGALQPGFPQAPLPCPQPATQPPPLMGCLLVVPAWLCLVSVPGPCPRSGAPWVPDRPP